MPAARCFQLLGLATLLLVASFLDERLAWAALALDLGLARRRPWWTSGAPPAPRCAASRRWPPLLVQEAPAEVAVSVARTAGPPAARP